MNVDWDASGVVSLMDGRGCGAGVCSFTAGSFFLYGLAIGGCVGTVVEVVRYVLGIGG